MRTKLKTGRTQVAVLFTAAALALPACRHTKPGTHVEIVDKGGSSVYVAGAANIAVNKTAACRGAVRRAVAAIALRFAQENDDLADDVADAVGTSDGEVFMQRYAKATAIDAAVPNVEFDPIEHVCKATVRWTPPIFVKEAVLKYAEKLKAAELGGGSTGRGATTPSSPATPTTPGRPSTPPPPPVSVAPPAAATATAPACPKQRTRLAKTLAASQKKLDKFNECLRRTENDETICHRYKLYVQEATKKEGAAGQALADCLNGGLSVTLRRALTRELPGHAAVSVETRADGTLVLWAFSPVDQTAFAIEVATSGEAKGRTPLAANQVQWVREQLNL